jgi:hypothetical protein
MNQEISGVKESETVEQPKSIPGENSLEEEGDLSNPRVIIPKVSAEESSEALDVEGAKVHWRSSATHNCRDAFRSDGGEKDAVLAVATGIDK